MSPKKWKNQVFLGLKFEWNLSVNTWRSGPDICVLSVTKLLLPKLWLKIFLIGAKNIHVIHVSESCTRFLEGANNEFQNLEAILLGDIKQRIWYFAETWPLYLPSLSILTKYQYTDDYTFDFQILMLILLISKTYWNTDTSVLFFSSVSVFFIYS